MVLTMTVELDKAVGHFNDVLEMNNEELLTYNDSVQNCGYLVAKKKTIISQGRTDTLVE